MGCIFDMNGPSDYLELYAVITSITSGTPVAGGTDGSYFGAFRLGV